MALAIVATGLSCRTNQESIVKEAPRSGDGAEFLGGTVDRTWSYLRQDTGASIETPWTDTYWPLTNKGLADTWLASTSSSGADVPYVYVSPWQQISLAVNLWNSGDTEGLSLLSPGLKYDLLKSGGNVNIENFTNLKTQHQNLTSVSAVERAAKSQNRLLREFKVLNKNFENTRNNLTNLYGDLIYKRDIIQRMKAQLESDISINLKKQIQSRLKIEKSSYLVTMSRLVKMRAKLGGPMYNELFDIYTKLNQADAQLYSLMAGTNAGPLTASLSEAQDSFYMTSDGWSDWATYAGTNDDKGSWGWMGHCHGWAPAALYEPKPKHAVMASLAGKNILFTEGDIRGLLTKLWSDQSPQAVFVGNRCNTEDGSLQFDSYGRVVDGVLCAEGESCTQGSGKNLYIQGGTPRKGLIRFKENLEDSSQKFALIIGGGANDVFDVAVYDSLEVFNQNLSYLNSGDYRNSTKATLKYLMKCRDTNAMTLYLALHEQIKLNQHGFIIDKTKTSEVWNQPLYKYEHTYLPIPMADGSMSVAGDPVSIEKINDPFAEFRAPGTKFLVQVQTKLYYGMENGPKISYVDADEAFASDTMLYTLELDKDTKVIGGEWGPIPAETDESYDLLSTMERPDFIWSIPKEKAPKNGPIDYDLVKKIQNCSLDTSKPLKTAAFAGKLAGVKYVDCVL